MKSKIKWNRKAAGTYRSKGGRFSLDAMQNGWLLVDKAYELENIFPTKKMAQEFAANRPDSKEAMTQKSMTQTQLIK